MAFGIYKQGQGYWVRTLTAVFLGVLFFVAAGWGWDQAVGIKLPAKAHDMPLTIVRGDVPAPGTLLVLERAVDDTSFEQIGSGSVASFATSEERRGTLQLTDLTLSKDDVLVTSVTRLRSESGAAEFLATVSSVRPIPLLPELYVQAGVAGAIILLGTFVVLWFVGTSRKTVEFLIATDGEMKKVNWSTKKEVIGSTQVVIVAAFLIAAILFVIDLAFSNFFQLIGVLET